jgi:hypothetical protein
MLDKGAPNLKGIIKIRLDKNFVLGCAQREPRSRIGNIFAKRVVISPPH